MARPKTKVRPVRVTGPLGSYANGFGEFLASKGYSPLSAVNMLRVMDQLSRWLGERRIPPRELTPDVINRFLRDRRSAGYTFCRSAKGLGPLLEHLRQVGMAPMPSPDIPVGVVPVLVDSYAHYLAVERGLSAGTIRRCSVVAHSFLVTLDTLSDGGLDLDQLDAQRVTEFVRVECTRRPTGSAKNLVAALRSLLRYLHLQGWTPHNLAPAVPAVAGWRQGSLPRGLSATQVTGLLRVCDRRRAVGRRDYAIITVLVRLGLRAAEVARLELDDVDWRAGEVLVNGKGRRVERLPLPSDVGEAVAAYLRHARPLCAERGLFLRMRAPMGPMTSDAVLGVVGHAGVKAGFGPIGAHRLRHTAATDMLRSGAALAEVGLVLRHQSLSTTAIYAKVDRDALRRLVLPWPGGAA